VDRVVSGIISAPTWRAIIASTWSHRCAGHSSVAPADEGACPETAVSCTLAAVSPQRHFRDVFNAARAWVWLQPLPPSSD